MTKVFKDTNGKFRNAQGGFLTKALFLEKNDFENKEGVLFTLKEKETLGYPSLKEMYFDLDDPTEYRVALECFEGWDHWVHLCSISWFKERVDSWRTEMAVKRASEGLDRVISTVRANNKESLNAAKYLLSNSWLAGDKKSTRAKAGRPSRESVKGSSRFNESDVKDDADRILNSDRTLN